jgi:hypothetical protein
VHDPEHENDDERDHAHEILLCTHLLLTAMNENVSWPKAGSALATKQR